MAMTLKMGRSPPQVSGSIEQTEVIVNNPRQR